MNTFISYKNDFISNDKYLFDRLTALGWRDDMKSRKTLSFGVPYNSSNVQYGSSNIPDFLEKCITLIKSELGFSPNNILANLYEDGNSKMGFHSDDLEVLEQGTGVAIISLGSLRTMRFKHKNSGAINDIELQTGSLIYLSPENQENYLHAILKSTINDPRISLSFRLIRILN